MSHGYNSLLESTRRPVSVVPNPQREIHLVPAPLIEQTLASNHSWWIYSDLKSMQQQTIEPGDGTRVWFTHVQLWKGNKSHRNAIATYCCAILESTSIDAPRLI
jgi:hypothetical protein